MVWNPLIITMLHESNDRVASVPQSSLFLRHGGYVLVIGKKGHPTDGVILPKEMFVPRHLNKSCG